MTWTVHELPDVGVMGHVVRVRESSREYGSECYSVDFQVFAVLCWPVGKPELREFERPDVISPMDNPTTNLDEARTIIDGYVKWDGCSDVNIHESHFCGKKDAMDLGILLGKVYDFAKLLMPTTWSKECWGEPATSAAQPPKGGDDV